MNRMTKPMLIGILALGSAGLIGTSYASPGEGNHEHCMHKDRMMGHGMKQGGRGFNIERMAEHLNLTTEQREKIEAIVAETRPQAQEIRKQMQDNRKLLRELSSSGSYDKEAVRKLADAQGNLKADMIMLRTEQKSKIREVLTEEQRNTMNAMWEKRHRN